MHFNRGMHIWVTINQLQLTNDAVCDDGICANVGIRCRVVRDQEIGGILRNIDDDRALQEEWRQT